MASDLERVRIILVEPAGALNVGSIARIMKNMGLSQLAIVNARCEVQGSEARQMAVHAAEILETACHFRSLSAALADCQRAIATTDRPRTLLMPLEHPRTALSWLLEPVTAPARWNALVFGPEDRGLSNDEINVAQRCVGIPAHSAYTSLNLAQAVAICSYELYQHLTQHPIPNPTPPPTPASVATLEDYFQHLENALLRIGYLYPHTATSRLEKFRYLLNRAEPSTEEVAMLRGIIRQLEWALDHPTHPE